MGNRMMNANSLANLTKPKDRRGGRGHLYKVPQETIDELFTLVANGSTLKQSAKKVGICFETAQKYFKKGDPTRGIKPLSYRLSIFQEKISEKLDVICEEARANNLKRVSDILEKMNSALFDPIMEKDKDGKEIKADPSLPKFTYRDYERMLKLQMYLLGASSSMPVGKEKITEHKVLSAEQIMGKK